MISDVQSRRVVFVNRLTLIFSIFVVPVKELNHPPGLTKLAWTSLSPETSAKAGVFYAPKLRWIPFRQILR